MKLEQQSPIIKDPETEAAEFENILKDMGKMIAQSCSRPGKSGMNYTEFKAHFLKQLSKNHSPILTHGSH